MWHDISCSTTVYCIQSSGVITRPNSSRHCIPRCDNSARKWTRYQNHNRHPISLALTRELWGVYCEDFWRKLTAFQRHRTVLLIQYYGYICVYIQYISYIFLNSQFSPFQHLTLILSQFLHLLLVITHLSWMICHLAMYGYSYFICPSLDLNLSRWNSPYNDNTLSWCRFHYQTGTKC